MVPKVEPTNISSARCGLRSSGSRRRVSCIGTSRFTVSCCARAASSCCSSRPKRLTPAAWITQSSSPQACAAAVTASSPATSLRSAATWRTWPGKRATSAASGAGSRPTASTWAPAAHNCSTSAWPMPPLAPVSSTLQFANSIDPPYCVSGRLRNMSPYRRYTTRAVCTTASRSSSASSRFIRSSKKRMCSRSRLPWELR